MSGKQKTERVQTVMTPGGLRAIDGWPLARRSRSEAIRRPIRLGLEAKERRANATAARAGGCA